MTDEPQISILDARLAEIDRRLRTIQTGLADDAGSPAESDAPLPPRIAVPEPGGSVPRPAAPAPRVAADANSPAAADANSPAAADANSPTAADASSQAPVSSGEDPSLVIAALRGLISDQARLLDAMGELLTSGETLLARATAAAREERPPAAPSSPASGPLSQPPVSETAVSPLAVSPPAVSHPAVSEVSVTAGPFSSLNAVRDFERALGMLPNVASVAVRGYEGEDRAVVDVHFSPSNP